MDTNFVSSDMIRGHIDTIILLSLSNEDKHSNEIREEIEKKADGKYQVKQGTFYSALQRLAKQGFVTEYRSSAKDSIRRKYFHLTEKGKKFVEDNVSQWNYSKSIINNMIFNEDKDEQPDRPIIVTNETQYEFERLLQENIADYEINKQPDDLTEYFESLNENLKSVTPPPVYNEHILDDESDYEENLQNDVNFEQSENETEKNTTETLQENLKITNISDFNENCDKDTDDNNSSLNAEFLPENKDLTINEDSEPQKYYVCDNYDKDNYACHNDITEKYNDSENLSCENNNEVNVKEKLSETNDNIKNLCDTDFEESYNPLTNTPLNNDFSYNNSDIEIDNSVEQVKEIKNEEISDKITDNEFNDNDLSIEEKTDKIDSNRDVFNLELEVRQHSENPVTEEIGENEINETIKDNAPDNSYVNSKTILFGQNEEKEVYDSLLEKLFPKKTSVFSDVTPTEKTLETKKEKFDDNVIENEFDKLIKEQNTGENDVVKEKNETIYSPLKNSYKNIDKFTYNYSTAKNEKFDYTDIIKIARQEGFKVRASNAITHIDKDRKIFINKLNFHTSLLFFVSFLIQLFVLFLTFKFNQGFNGWFYITSAMICACIPIVFLILYLRDKNKTITNINKFRDSIEIVFIIALNLILLICAIAIISDINFSSGKDLLRYLIIPIVYVLNLPLFFIFKYSLLEKNGYIK